MKNLVGIVLIFVFLPLSVLSKSISREEAEVAYKTLNLKFNSSLKDAKLKRGQLAREKHPDVVGTDEFLEEVKNLNRAVDIIKKWLMASGEENSLEEKTVFNERESAFEGSLMNVNQEAYLSLLFNSQYFKNGSVFQNMDSMFDLIYRLYSVGYTHDVLDSLSRLFFNPFAGPGSFKYEAAFPGLSQLFGNQGGGALVSNFQLFKATNSMGYESYSHILVHFDAKTTQMIGLPRFRIFLIRPGSNSADEMLALYRNHNNQLPRLQVYQKRKYNDLYMVNDSGVRTLARPAHEDISSVDLSIMDAGNPNPPRLVQLDYVGRTNVVNANQLNLKDLGHYLSPVGMRFIRLGNEWGASSSYADFERMYTAVDAENVIDEVAKAGILEKIQNANAEHFLWPKLIGSAAFIGVNREDFNAGRQADQLESECDQILGIDSKRWLQ